MAVLDDDSKVMDVSKPGKGKPVSTSRPVVAPVVSETAADESVSPAMPAAEEPAPLKSPSSSHKVIAPLSDDLKQEAQGTPEDEPKSNDTATQSPEAAAVSTDDAAGVDALVSTAETKKEVARKAQEQAKKDAELQAFIDSKKYVVPIKAAAASSGKSWILGIITVIVILAGGYLLADAGMFGSDVKVPFELFKDKETAAVTQDTKVPSSAADKDSGAKSEQKPAESDDDKAAPEASTVTPEVRARDEDRKNELKNLQQWLETYFNDNAVYPANLTAPEHGLTADQRTDDTGNVYLYESDGETYTLSTTLENKNDTDAVGGVYTVESVNQ